MQELHLIADFAGTIHRKPVAAKLVDALTSDLLS